MPRKAGLFKIATKSLIASATQKTRGYVFNTEEKVSKTS